MRATDASASEVGQTCATRTRSAPRPCPAGAAGAALWSLAARDRGSDIARASDLRRVRRRAELKHAEKYTFFTRFRDPTRRPTLDQNLKTRTVVFVCFLTDFLLLLTIRSK